MVAYFVEINEGEEIVKEFNTKHIRVIITDKRLILEGKEQVFSIKLDVIGMVQFIRKGANKNALRLYAKTGKELFPYSQYNRIEFLDTPQAKEFEQALAERIL